MTKDFKLKSNPLFPDKFRIKVKLQKSIMDQSLQNFNYPDVSSV